MKKLKLYLETSFISFLTEPEDTEYKKNALLLWEKIKQNNYDIIISEVTMKELEGNLNKEVREQNMKNISELSYQKILINDEINVIAELLKESNILAIDKLEADRMHIGSALYAGADVIVSFNFKHLVNIQTIKGVRILTISEGYKNIEIVHPASLL
jgi:predicted nucleic acid-binding protein